MVGFHRHLRVDAGAGAARARDGGLRARPRGIGALPQPGALGAGGHLARPAARLHPRHQRPDAADVLRERRQRPDRTIRWTAGQRFDRIRTFTVSVLNRALTLFGFSPQLAVIHEARLTNAQAQDYDRNRAELRFVRQF